MSEGDEITITDITQQNKLKVGIYMYELRKENQLVSFHNVTN